MTKTNKKIFTSFNSNQKPFQLSRTWQRHLIPIKYHSQKSIMDMEKHKKQTKDMLPI